MLWTSPKISLSPGSEGRRALRTWKRSQFSGNFVDFDSESISLLFSETLNSVRLCLWEILCSKTLIDSNSGSSAPQSCKFWPDLVALDCCYSSLVRFFFFVGIFWSDLDVSVYCCSCQFWLMWSFVILFGFNFSSCHFDRHVWFRLILVLFGQFWFDWVGIGRIWSF